MRNLAIRIVLFLCSRFDIMPLDETRIPMGDEPKARSERWQAFAKEQGGLFDMLDGVRASYLAAMGKVAPGDAKTLEALAIGAHVAEKLRAEVRSVIASGEIAQRTEDAIAKQSARPIRKSI